MDESYNNRTFCVGGWLASDARWNSLENAWKMRIEHERRISIKKGFPPISRYHASDCSNLLGEFDRAKGWNKERQVLFCKRLFEIIGNSGLIGIVIGGSRSDFIEHFSTDKESWQEGIYYLSTVMFLVELEIIMKRSFPREKVSIYYDRGKFGPWASRAFNSLKKEAPQITKDRFVTIAPKDWEHCIPLQPADLMAYEGFKRIDGLKNNRDQIRKSLQALIGKKIEFEIGHMPGELFSKAIEETKRKNPGQM
jgi:hypothetical protein